MCVAVRSNTPPASVRCACACALVGTGCVALNCDLQAPSHAVIVIAATTQRPARCVITGKKKKKEGTAGGCCAVLSNSRHLITLWGSMQLCRRSRSLCKSQVRLYVNFLFATIFHCHLDLGDTITLLNQTRSSVLFLLIS